MISLVIPIFNEELVIDELLERSLATMKGIGEPFEIIIVDDGSDDKTPEIGRNLEANGLIDKFIRNEMRGGKASAANLAWRYCSGKYLLHLDADSSFDRDAVERIIIPFYLDSKIGGVGGNVQHARNFERVFITLRIGRLARWQFGCCYRKMPAFLMRGKRIAPKTRLQKR